MVSNGWPDTKQQVRIEARPYWSFRDEVATADGLLFKGTRLIVAREKRPGDEVECQQAWARAEMLCQIHKSHLGIVKCRQRARYVLFWPECQWTLGRWWTIYIKKNCSVCADYTSKQPSEPLKPAFPTSLPKKKIGKDLFEFRGGHYLLSVCYRSTPSQDEAIRSMETCISDVKQWMTSEKLMLNDNKTEFIVIASRHLLKKAAVNTIRVGDCNVSKVSVVQNLGVWLDDQLTMAVHITKICSVAFYDLHDVRRIRKYLSMDAAVTLIHSFVSSRIDYCNSLLYGVPKCHIDKLQRVQNAAARLVVMQGKFCHITSVLHQLHWLPVSFRINFTILPLTFKAIHELAPSSAYINDLVKIKPLNDLTTEYCMLSHPNFKTLTSLGDRAFVALAPKLWNDLPLEIRMCKSVDTFKKILKTHLFSNAFHF